MKTASKQIIVFFLDNHKVLFDREKVVFVQRDGSIFMLDQDGTVINLKPDNQRQAAAPLCVSVSGGCSIVNWETVCYLKEHEEDPEDDDL